MKQRIKWGIGFSGIILILFLLLAGSLLYKKQSEDEVDVTTESTIIYQGDQLQGQIMVAMAASLKNAYEEILPLFHTVYPEISVTGIFDASGKLQTQIEEGLEADVFFPASSRNMDALAEADLVDRAEVVNLLENEIVLIVFAGNPAGLQHFEDITKASIVVIGDPESVPAGQYAREALTNLGLWEKFDAKVSFASNVTEVLQQVAAAGADAGIVYATDAASRPGQVEVVEAAPQGSLAAPVLYPVAKLKSSANPQAAQAFVDFLQTPEAVEIFEKYGFACYE